MAKDNRDHIIRNFDRVRLALATDKWTLRPDESIREIAASATVAKLLGMNEPPQVPEDLNALGTVGLESVIDKMRQHRRQHESFYRAFDYAWTLNASNYTHLLEGLYQYFLLEVMADIDPRHSNWSKLDDIAIRILPTGSLNSECIHDHGYKYVMLATPFLKILQATLVTLKILGDIGRRAKKPQNLWVRSNHLNGQNVEIALREDFKACEPHLLNLLADVFYYATHGEFEIPNARTPKLMGTITTRSDLNYLILYEATEMFAVCHELAHILEHDEASRARSASEEHEADFYGASLYLIYNSKNMKTAHSFLSGPALFFSTMRMFVMCRNLLGMLRREAAFDAPEYVEEEQVLKSRAFEYEKYNKLFGTIPERDSTYKDIMAELWVLTAACQVTILGLFGKPSSRSLDDFLPQNY